MVQGIEQRGALTELPSTPLVTCLSGALDGHYPESLTGGWLAVFIWILGFDHHRLPIVDFRDVGLLEV